MHHSKLAQRTYACSLIFMFLFLVFMVAQSYIVPEGNFHDKALYLIGMLASLIGSFGMMRVWSSVSRYDLALGLYKLELAMIQTASIDNLEAYLKLDEKDLIRAVKEGINWNGIKVTSDTVDINTIKVGLNELIEKNKEWKKNVEAKKPAKPKLYGFWSAVFFCSDNE